MPPDFSAWTYGHAVTSYRSQGSTSEESLLLLGNVAARALGRREFYVGNTRYRGALAIYVSRKADILERLAQPDTGRELATEFLERQQISEEQLNEMQQRHRREVHRRAAWRFAEMQRRRETQGVRQSL